MSLPATPPVTASARQRRRRAFPPFSIASSPLPLLLLLLLLVAAVLVAATRTPVHAFVVPVAPLPTSRRSRRHGGDGRGGSALGMGKGGGGGGKKKKGGELQEVLERYEPVVGVEVHAQLLSATKAYCGCSTHYNPNLPNVNICPICTGEPGSLPLPNARVVELASKAALALNCQLAGEVRYDRKNYFYPDTPKNYQITQYTHPLGGPGHLELPSGKSVAITRLHMEEDSAKMLHQGADSLAGSTHSLVDFNRAGIPLAEIVSEPDMRSGAEAAEYGRELQKVLRYVGASDGNMAEGSLRLDVNISIRPRGEQGLRAKVEVKNVNSFKSVQQAVDFEVLRQARAYDQGEVVRQETRMWDEKDLATKLMRVKEGESDYRYFPEPDVPPLVLAPAQVEAWRSELQELPAAKRARYQAELGLDAETTKSLTEDLDVAQFYEAAVAVPGTDAKEAAKWLVGDVFGYLNGNKGTAKSCADMKLTPAGLAELVGLIGRGKITGKIAKEILPELLDVWEGGVLELVQDKGMEAITDPAVIAALVQQVIEANPEKVADYKAGKTKLLGFLVGMVLKESGSKADPQLSQQLMEKALDG